MRTHRWNTPVVSVVVFAAASGLLGCGDDDGDGSIIEVIGEMSSCQEILDGVEFAELDANEAEVVADRMYAIASDQVADDGVVEEYVPCSTVIRELDDVHPDAVEGTDLERLEEETRAELGGG